jgi:mono/diheme cytochrome c family protein
MSEKDGSRLIRLLLLGHLFSFILIILSGLVIYSFSSLFATEQEQLSDSIKPRSYSTESLSSVHVTSIVSAPEVKLNQAKGNNQKSYTAEQVSVGEKTYNTYCIACHQEGGAGKVGFAPSIRNQDFLALASDTFIKQTIKTGRPGTAMVPWAFLKDEEIEGIIAYLRSFPIESRKKIVVDDSKKHSGDSVAGKESFGLYCASCHGEHGAGYSAGGAGPGIGLSGFLAVASDDYIFQTVKHGRSGSAMRGFIGSTGLANLTEVDVNNIISYLRNPDSGISKSTVVVSTAGDTLSGEQQFNMNCSSCHQLGGIGKSGFAPSIRNQDFLAIASDDFIKQTIKSGRPGTAMIARADLSDKVVADIISYLRSAPGEKPSNIHVDSSKKFTGDAIKGHQLFGNYCSSCHGENGAGYVSGGPGPAIGKVGFLNIASDDYIYQTLKLGRAGTAMKPFIGSKGLANLNDQDAYDIINYLRSIKN